jgi:hypothetical protein
MRLIVRILEQQFVGVIALALVLGGGAYAATGGNLKLGLTNTANQPTTMKSTGNGAVLSLDAKAGQPALAVDTANVIKKLNADLLDGRNSSAYARTGSSYTRAESDARYYTKAGSDARYALAGQAYTKGESDNRYYTTSASDARYGQIVYERSFSGMTTAQMNVENVLHTENFSVPGPGVLLLIVSTDASSHQQAAARVRLNGVVRGTSSVSDSQGHVTTGGIPVTSAGGVTVQISFTNFSAPAQVSGSGRVAVVFFKAD